MNARNAQNAEVIRAVATMDKRQADRALSGRQWVRYRRIWRWSAVRYNRAAEGDQLRFIRRLGGDAFEARIHRNRAFALRTRAN